MKRVILCYKEHDKCFIWYYYAYDISNAILDLDPDLCQNFLSLELCQFCPHTHMYDTSNESCAQGLYFFFLHLRALSNLWGRYDPKTENADVFAHNLSISSHRIMCNASIESFIQVFISFSYTDKLGAIYGDVMTKKHENLMIYRCFQ